MNEVIKDLPEIFDEFADARKNAFLSVKELKDKDIPPSWSLLYIFSSRNRMGSRSNNCWSMLN